MMDNSEPVRRFFRFLSSYRNLPEELHGYLLDNMRGKFYPAREILFEHGDIVKDAVFIFSGYVCAYGFNEWGGRQLISIHPGGAFIAARSFLLQSPSDLELVALAGAYLILIGHKEVMEIFERFEGTRELAVGIIADFAEKEQMRLLLLSKEASAVVLEFYRSHPEILGSGLLLDADLASYMLIGEQTLRNVRMKLIKQGKL
ncbi:Crp/Fnr family transcriptional regulator [Pedobacter psychrodurus]|uniref:Crp/Fnr family transcriptional regulator n=1 Tax=Pedobacter psychrodurus TaxID=2530456 RepID=A0A4R0Q9P4_9SPHI|nr:cyclic nucleotide-binding domain-containing protein [Pedobacter psychrodurus]TCD28624.1 Crp/Fnr family transcriptional regulator [Pedobacter psychrodurus]